MASHVLCLAIAVVLCFAAEAWVGAPHVYYASNSDSGDSANNLAHARLLGPAGKQSAVPVGPALKWLAHNEADPFHNVIYRGTSPEFLPGSGNLFEDVPDVTRFDHGRRLDSRCYCKISTDDICEMQVGLPSCRPMASRAPRGPPCPPQLASNRIPSILLQRGAESRSD